MLARILSIVGLVSAGLLLILLTTTTPSRVGAPGILAVFILIYSTILCFLTFFMWFGVKIANRIGQSLHVFHRSVAFPLKRSYYFASVLALGPVIIISLQAVGGIGLYEIGMVCLFLFLGCVYVSRRIA